MNVNVNLNAILQSASAAGAARMRSLVDPNTPLDEESAKRLFEIMTPLQRMVAQRVAIEGHFDPNLEARQNVMRMKHACNKLVEKGVFVNERGRFVFAQRIIDFNERQEGRAQ